MRLSFFHFFGKSGNDLKQIADYAQVRDPEDRRLGILVDGDNMFGCLDADMPARCWMAPDTPAAI